MHIKINLINNYTIITNFGVLVTVNISENISAIINTMNITLE